MHGSEWFSGHQRPPGSPHVYLPENTGEFNTWPNNYVGAAFMYRDRVFDLLGDFSPHRFTIEDHDYWMRVNELLCLRHVDFDDRVYDYRFHQQSLTSKGEELQILDLREELMVFDDFRRDFALSPLVWFLSETPSSPDGQKFLEAVRARAESAGHLVGLPEVCDPALLPRLWFPAVCVAWADDPSEVPEIPGDLPRGCLNVLLTGLENLPGAMCEGWHVCATAAPTDELTRLDESFQGWYGFPSAASDFMVLDVRA